MHAVGAGGERPVEAVVHDELHAGSGEGVARGDERGEGVAVRAALGAELDGARAAGGGAARLLGVAGPAAVREAMVREHVEAGEGGGHPIL